MSEIPKYHEFIEPVLEIKDIVMGWLGNLAVPSESLELPHDRGAEAMLSREQAE